MWVCTYDGVLLSCYLAAFFFFGMFVENDNTYLLNLQTKALKTSINLPKVLNYNLCAYLYYQFTLRQDNEFQVHT